MRLGNKVSIVTGGGSGLGAATSRLLAKEGAKVLVADIRYAAAEETAKKISVAGGSAYPLKVDVTNADEVESMVMTAIKKFGKLDVMFNAAGMAGEGDVVELSESEWRRTMDINVTSIFLCLKYAIPKMIENGGGSIINAASIKNFTGDALSCVYPASKAAVVLLSRQTARKYASHNIRVNCVCPGHCETPMVLELYNTPEKMKTLLAKYPMGRLGKPMEVANAVLFLASDESSFITGSEITIDGGYLA